MADEEDDDFVKQIQRIALANVVLGPKSPDAEDAWLRHIFRWYSHEFATPLHTVGDQPLADVLLHYYESLYEQFEDPEIEEERVRLVETKEERRQRAIAKISDEVSVQQLIKEVEEAERRRLEKQATLGAAATAAVPEKKAGSRKFLAESVFPRAAKKEAPKEPPKEEPVLRLTFEDLGDEASMPGMVPPKKR